MVLPSTKRPFKYITSNPYAEVRLQISMPLSSALKLQLPPPPCALVLCIQLSVTRHHDFRRLYPSHYHALDVSGTAFTTGLGVNILCITLILRKCQHFYGSSRYLKTYSDPALSTGVTNDGFAFDNAICRCQVLLVVVDKLHTECLSECYRVRE